MLPRVNRRAPQPDVDSPIVMPSLFIDSPVGESPTYSDLEEEPMAPLLLPKTLIKQGKKKTENIVLKYPIDIKNLIPREVLVHDDFGSSKQTVYDVSSFSAITYLTKQTGFTIRKDYPDYQFRIYSYRATSKSMKAGTVVGNIRLNYSIDHYKQFVHVNMELSN